MSVQDDSRQLQLPATKRGACYKWRVLGGDCVLSVSSSSGNVRIRAAFYNNTSSFNRQVCCKTEQGAMSKEQGVGSKENEARSKGSINSMNS